MKTRAAIMRATGQDWEVTELELDPPKTGEVLVRFVASGLCHSDEHIRTGDLTPRFPIVGGHEGAGVVEEVGPGVTSVETLGTDRFRMTADRDVRSDAAYAVVGANGSLRRLSVDEPSLEAIYARYFQDQTEPTGGTRHAA